MPRKINNNNYFFKFKYQNWLETTTLLKPIQRDILHNIVCRRAVNSTVGVEINDKELNEMRMHYFRGLRKEAYLNHLQPLIDKKLVIKSPHLNSNDHSYTTKFNELYENELREKELKKEKKRLEEELKKRE